MTHEQTADEKQQSAPFKVAGRYQARELLGRGGMASVYEAWDENLGAPVALKLLTVDADPRQAARTVELFEREFHTLVQLAHPRIVRALDYGVEGDQPYYTLELLDGGDLRDLAPLPWQDVCTVAYEICSALSLLHSRGLVHRDLTPRNIRKTQSGEAKLIDFGLLSPMGSTALLAGTPPFVPPELVRTLSLDGRGDLFSLGATLYYALTKRQPYPARSFEQLPDAWRSRPPRPSSLVSDIPAALDEILLGMLRLDAGSRPKSAAEVMERLLPLLASPPNDELRAARAYLVTPKLVGRDAIVAQFRKRMLRAVRGHGGGFAVVGEEGAGRSRLLDAFVLEAKLLGATAVRAGREDAGRAFGVAASLVQQIHRAAPDVARAAAASQPNVSAVLYTRTNAAEPAGVVLADITRPGLDRAELQVALRSWVLEFSARRPLAIAVDDLERIDEPSAALIASLTRASATLRLVYAAVIPPAGAGVVGAIEIVRANADEIKVEPLGTQGATELFRSLFGNVPNLGVLSDRIMALSAGRPRECMMFAQYLVNTGAISYAGGSWTLPAEILETLLPANLEAAFGLRVAGLGQLARHVAALLAENLLERLDRTDLLSLGLANAALVDAAIDELIAARLAIGDPTGYALTGTAIARMLSASLGHEERRRVHDELSTLHERAGRHTLVVAHHALSGSRAEEALSLFARETPDTSARTVFILSALETVNERAIALALDHALCAAERLGRSPAELQSLRALVASTSARGADAAYFYRVAGAWLRQAKHDSGYDDWERLDPTLESMPRAMMAVSMAIQRYGETPEAARGQTPQEGIQQLVAYVLFAIAVSSRVLDLELQSTFTDLLVPFAPLNPLVAAILMDARATVLHSEGRREHSRTAFAEVLSQLENVSGAELGYVDKVRAAVWFALAAVDTMLGIPSESLSRFAELEDPNHKVSALHLKKVAALQQGDWELAEKYRQAGELFSLQAKATSMFSTLGDELEVHAMARDLTGLRRIRAGVRVMAEKSPGYIPMLQVADAQYLRLCGDAEGALEALSPALTAPESQARRDFWTSTGRILAVELLSGLGRAEEALALGQSELTRCESRGMRQQTRLLSLALAIAEAKLGQHEAARSRAESVVTEQLALGITGLQLGQSYEALARIAITRKDGPEFLRFSALVRDSYRVGKSSVLGALYERLMDEGRQAGLADTAVSSSVRPVENSQRSSTDYLTSLLAGCEGPRERAERALGLLCDGDPPTRGHLLLSKAGGLVLAASNIPCTSVSEVISFASDCLERESNASSMETGSFSQLSLGALSTEWRDSDGNDYEVVLLSTTLAEGFCIGGVALLARSGPPRAGYLGHIAEAVARALITVGDAVSVAA